MTSEIEIRPESERDAEAIGQLIQLAFTGMPYADGNEAELVVALRAQDALSVSLVADREGAVVGQVVFSPARASDGGEGWFALGPVAVLPEFQGRGIGSALIRAGLRDITEMGASGCILTGNPAYYSRFGFELSPESAPPGEPAEFFMVKLLRGDVPVGSIYFHEAF